MNQKVRRKNNACAKCRTDCTAAGGYVTEGGLSFYFCRLCLQILEDMPQGNKVHLFLYDKTHKQIKSRVTRDVLSARLRRAAGISPWSKAALH